VVGAHVIGSQSLPTKMTRNQEHVPVWLTGD
jgi:hypothetical protein